MENRLLDEYKDSSANMRHYANHFVAFLSLFLALTGGLLSVLFGRNPPDSQTAVTLLQTFGLIVTILFWVMTESAHYLWGHFARRAAAIECKLNFEQYRRFPAFHNFDYGLPRGRRSLCCCSQRGFGHIEFVVWLLRFCFASYVW